MLNSLVVCRNHGTCTLEENRSTNIVPPSLNFSGNKTFPDPDTANNRSRLVECTNTQMVGPLWLFVAASLTKDRSMARYSIPSLCCRGKALVQQASEHLWLLDCTSIVSSHLDATQICSQTRALHWIHSQTYQLALIAFCQHSKGDVAAMLQRGKAQRPSRTSPNLIPALSRLPNCCVNCCVDCWLLA